MQPAPFYADWTFWAFAVSAVAIVLSQVPPLRHLLRPGRLVMESANRVHVNHMIGFLNVQLYLSLRNIGGRPLRVRNVSIALSRHDKPVANVEAQNYVRNEAEPANTVWLLPFTLAAGDEWAHRVNAAESLVAKEDRALGKLRDALKADIGTKVRAWRKAHGEEPTHFLEADPDVIGPVMELYARKFVLEAGEYVITVAVHTDRAASDVARTYRFTLYDADSEELRSYADDYKYGFGPALDIERHRGVICQLHPVK